MDRDRLLGGSALASSAPAATVDQPAFRPQPPKTVNGVDAEHLSAVVGATLASFKGQILMERREAIEAAINRAIRTDPALRPIRDHVAVVIPNAASGDVTVQLNPPRMPIVMSFTPGNSRMLPDAPGEVFPVYDQGGRIA